MIGNREYFEQREAEERAAAEKATDERARRSHLELAEAYHDAAGRGDKAPDADAPSDTASTTATPDLRII